MTATTLRPRRVGELLDAGIKIYLGNARTLMGLAALVVVPLQVIAAVVLLSTVSSGSNVPTASFSLSTRTTQPYDPAARLGAQAVLLVVSLLGSWLTTAACVKSVSDTYLEQPTGLEVSLRYALRRLPALIGMEILWFLGLVAGFIALIVPGIWIYVLWSVAAPALLIEGLGPARAIGRSRQLVSGRWWPTAGVLLVATIMASVVSGALEALLSGIASVPSNPSVLLAVTVLTLSTTVATIIVLPFQASVITVMYYDLRVRREGFDLHLLAQQLGLPPLSQDATPGASHEGSEIAPARLGLPLGPESVGQPGGPPYWPPPPGWTPGG